MSLRKPIIKVKKKCSKCKGSGQKTIKGKRPEPYLKSFKILGKYMYIIIDCPKCNGIGFVDVKQNAPKFKKYYIKNLEEEVNYLTTKYRNAKAEAFYIGKELRKYCKELDKVVNK